MKTQYFVFGIMLLIVACTNSQKVDSSHQSDLNTHSPSFPERAKDMTIYEVNIRQHTPEGTFKAFQEQLPRIKEVGADNFMVHAHPTHWRKKQKRQPGKLLFHSRL